MERKQKDNNTKRSGGESVQEREASEAEFARLEVWPTEGTVAAVAVVIYPEILVRLQK